MARRGSGGAEALLARRVASRPSGAPPPATASTSDSPFGAMFGAIGGMFAVPLERLSRDPAQPRRDFDERQLDELAANMKVVGQIEPAIVRPEPDRPGHYIIVVGERRWRAAAKASFSSLQCILRAEDVRLVPAKQWSENHFRAELSPIEEAGGLKAIMEIEGLDAVQAAERYGISERTIRRHLALLEAPVWIQAAVVHGEEVALEDGTTERRKLDLTGAAELLRIFNTYLRRAEEAARAGTQASDESSGRDPQAAGARAQRKAEEVRQRALQEGWSRRRWQDFAAAAGREASSRAGPAGAGLARSPAWLFRSDEDRLVVHMRCIEGSTAAELQRLAQCLSDLLEQVRRKAQSTKDVEDRAAEKGVGREAAPGSGPGAEEETLEPGASHASGGAAR